MYLLQSRFLRGFLLGLSGASVLLYFWHTETLLAMQTSVEKTAPTMTATATSSPLQSQLHLVDLLQKSYSIHEGTEENDVRPQLQQNGHMPLVQQLLGSTRVDVSDLLDLSRPFTAAQFYAALMRIRHHLERQAALAELDNEAKKLLPSKPTP